MISPTHTPPPSLSASNPAPSSLRSINTTTNRAQSSSSTSPLTLGHSSLLSPSILESCLTNIDQPVQVILVVYDLLPAGNISTLAWAFGVGLYHSAVKIPAIRKEITFGGHPHSEISGIFALPIQEDGSSSMPGLRRLCEIDMGHVRTIEQMNPLSSPAFRQSVSTFHEDDESRGLIRPPPSAAKLDKHKSDSSQQDYSYPPTPSISATISPSHSNHHPYASSITSSLDSNKSSSSLLSSSLTQMETLALILDRLTRSPDWYGTSYDLLRRNCNTFSNQLCMLLTGKNAPNWINRAASVGSAFPCLVPTEWVEPPVAPQEFAQPVDYEGNYDHQFKSQKPISTPSMKVKSAATTSLS